MNNSITYVRLLLVSYILLNTFRLSAQDVIGCFENANFKSEFTRKGLSAFHTKDDTVNIIADRSVWGDVTVRYRVNNEDWNVLMTDFTRLRQTGNHTVLYTDSLIDMPLCMQRYYTLKDDGIHLRIEIATTGKLSVELGDVMLPVRWRPHGREGSEPESIFERGFIQKHNISVNSSYLIFSKPSGAGPFYMMSTKGNTPLEYFDTSNRVYNAYIHSACSGSKADGNWRIPHTGRLLSPAGQDGDKVVYEFVMTSVPRYEDIRETVYQQGLLDIRVAPGYTIPRDLNARIAIRLKGNIQSFEPEFPDQTEINPIGKGPNGSWLYDVHFNKLGENTLTVNYNNGEKSVLVYQIASNFPRWTHYLDAEGYFERAVQTAIAYFKYPYEVLPWLDIYKWGMYNEWLIPDIIAELEKRERNTEAGFLRGEWEKKAKYFIYDDKYPYRSEYSFDRTAFESSYALAKYAIENPMKPDKDLWFDKNKEVWYSHPEVTIEDARRFMDQQHYAGLSVRGWHAPKFYLAGADCASSSHTHDMSYMAMMGGWSILEYGLLFSGNTDWVELGYNSFLSSWSLMNTGDAASGYGYWYPGKEKDGSTGQAFVSAKNGITWLRKYETRGVWRYDGEIDLGFGATFHTARTIVIQDSVFGLHAYGGNLRVDNKSNLTVVPRDGVRQQFSYVVPAFRYHFNLLNDGFLKDEPILIISKGKQTCFTLENKVYSVTKDETASAHISILQIRAQKTTPKKVLVSGKSVSLRRTSTGWEIELPISKETEGVIIQWT